MAVIAVAAFQNFAWLTREREAEELVDFELSLVAAVNQLRAVGRFVALA
jgi:hypothetical protein